MSKIKVNGSFISEKVSKIRWIPEQYTSPTTFVTGSWDFNINSLKAWKLTPNEYSDDENEYVPMCTAKFPINGDVSGLEFVNLNQFVVSSTNGSVTIININKNITNENLSEQCCFKNLHKFDESNNAPCTGLSIFENDVATVGEDGSLNILSINGQSVIKTIENADNCSLTCVCFINHKEILTGNRMGLIKMFDVRANNDKPTATFLVSCDDDKKSNCVNCITFHPTQQHIVLSGSEEGSITVWDLRQPNYPASYLSAHETSITELAFHPTEPTKLFSTSECGELFQWSQNVAQITDSMDSQMKFNEAENINPWLSGERIKHKINWTPLIRGIRKPMNSFDATGSKIITSCDNEAIYLIENVN